MLKYTDTQVCFQEVPDEITLCINISNCPCHCEGCHSAYLAEDIGEPLDEWLSFGTSVLDKLIHDNKGITCIAFMGGDADPGAINNCAKFIKRNYPDIKTAWYSGRAELSKEVDVNKFDFIKLGPYLKECGPLNCKTTNQKFYKIVHTSMGTSKMYDITYKFWRNETED